MRSCRTARCDVGAVRLEVPHRVGRDARGVPEDVVDAVAVEVAGHGHVGPVDGDRSAGGPRWPRPPDVVLGRPAGVPEDVDAAVTVEVAHRGPEGPVDREAPAGEAGAGRQPLGVAGATRLVLDGIDAPVTGRGPGPAPWPAARPGRPARAGRPGPDGAEACVQVAARAVRGLDVAVPHDPGERRPAAGRVASAEPALVKGTSRRRVDPVQGELPRDHLGEASRRWRPRDGRAGSRPAPRRRRLPVLNPWLWPPTTTLVMPPARPSQARPKRSTTKL